MEIRGTDVAGGQQEKSSLHDTFRVCLFQDHFKFYQDTDGIETMVEPTTVMLSAIRDFEVVDTGFILHMKDSSTTILKSADVDDLESWVNTLSQIFEEQASSHVIHPTEEDRMSNASTATPVSLTPDPGTSSGPENIAAARRLTVSPPVHRGPLMVSRQCSPDARPGKADMNYVILYRDRLDHFADKANAVQGMAPKMVTYVEDVREVRLQDGGFMLGLAAETLTMRVPTALEAQAWADVLWMVVDPKKLKHEHEQPGEEMPSDRRFTALWSQNDLLLEQASMTASKLQHQLTGSHMDAWSAGLKEQPHHHGVLGFQCKGKLVNRYCVLFEDRLDMWEDPAAAVSGRRPLDRIVLKSLRSLETVCGGFIINLGGGKRTGVHVSSKEELHEWSAALSGVVLSAGPNQASGGTGGNPRSARLTCQNQEAEASAQTARPAARSPDWLPRVATLPVKAEPRPVPPRKTFFSERSGGKSFACSTHPNAVMRDLNKDYAKVLTTTFHPVGEVTDKISKDNNCQARRA
jgi:hypothetical protein